MPQNHADTQELGLTEDWPAVLDAHDIQFLVLDIESDTDLVHCFGSQPGWRVDLTDAESVLFVRADAARTPNNHVAMRAHSPLTA